MTENVGAGILSIITESLYDKPLVVFREYVQNSVDSFMKVQNDIKAKLISKIWFSNNNLYFLDNGSGISKEIFNDAMIRIGASGKRKTENIGYKGIGRLSGISYCSKLKFINICDIKTSNFQGYFIDCSLYNSIKVKPDYYEMSFDNLISSIGEYKSSLNGLELIETSQIIKSNNDLFVESNTGFLVILENISSILLQAINEDSFIADLGWLLPVKFKNELYVTPQSLLFENMTEPTDCGVVAARGFEIYFHNTIIERPIIGNMLREYVCKLDLKYAVGFHSFFSDKISVMKGNSFSGIKIYIDNMLLCDESELLPALQRYGLIDHTVNELVQTVKGIGAMIYITDKVNISANARRTFIEVVDEDSLEFLKLLAEFVKNIYSARYALSKYSSGRKNLENNIDKLEDLRTAANIALSKLAQEEVSVENSDESYKDFSELNVIEQKQVVKRKITKEINGRIKNYLIQTSSYDYDNVFEDFKKWLSMN